jgi:hypothetical protein
MAKQRSSRGFEEAIAWFREHGFEVLDAPGTVGRVFLKKLNCSAAVERTSGDAARIFAYPGYLVGTENSKLVNRGYQQFLKTTKTEVPATADKLTALHQFVQEFQEGLGLPSLYNESLGTTSEDYLYDRVTGRDLPESTRPKPAWEHSDKTADKKRRA